MMFDDDDAVGTARPRPADRGFDELATEFGIASTALLQIADDVRAIRKALEKRGSDHEADHG
jgi:hypothetical protein